MTSRDHDIAAEINVPIVIMYYRDGNEWEMARIPWISKLLLYVIWPFMRYYTWKCAKNYVQLEAKWKAETAEILRVKWEKQHKGSEKAAPVIVSDDPTIGKDSAK
jgi:hypothetical protein